MASELLTADWAPENFYETTLSADITDTDTDIFLTGVPTNSEGTLVIDPDSATNREIIYYSSKTGTKVVCPGNGRGYDTSTAVSHTSGTKVIMAPIADWFNSLKTLFTTTPQGWTSEPELPDTITNNGNRSYDLVFNSTDLTDTLSEGMRLRLSRTVPAPTQCADLESGSSQYFTKTSPSGISFTVTWTAMAWVKLESYTEGGIISRRNADTEGWHLGVNAEGGLEAGSLRIAGNNSVTRSYQSLVLGKWTHVAAAVDLAGTTLLYIDGVLVPSLTTVTGTAATLVQGTTALNVGAQKSAGTFPWDGKIAQVALFSSKLSAATVASYMSQTLSGAESTCIGFFSLSNTLVDSSSNANTVTASGGALATNVDSPFGNYLGGTLEYAIISAKPTFSTNTTVTVQVPEGCAIPTSGGVSAVAYSTNKVPYGFPSSEGRWRVEYILKTQLNGTSSATYVTLNSNSLAFTPPVGAWEIGWMGDTFNTTATNVSFNLSPTALTGMSAAAGANASRLAARSLYAGGTGGSQAFVEQSYALSSATTFTMYTIGASAAFGIAPEAGTTELFAKFGLL